MKDMIQAHTSSYHDELMILLKDVEQATLYLKVALEEYEIDGDSAAFLLALRNVAEARGGITELANKSHLNRQNLYRVLSGKGNPTFQTLDAILHGLGFRLSIEPLEEKAA